MEKQGVKGCCRSSDGKGVFGYWVLRIWLRTTVRAKRNVVFGYAQMYSVPGLVFAFVFGCSRCFMQFQQPSSLFHGCSPRWCDCLNGEGVVNVMDVLELNFMLVILLDIPPQTERGLHSSIEPDVKRLLHGKTCAELEALQH
ncbi:hypothetical protein LR48_Vigan07g127700 [Vigna angularis]|uniref:Uncharacterized protein n=1 Tax=Phaseolus angularis TaxID=3914 RepID=A0A0L9UXT0_PHAAN|nr:hypothetical protein LR48_Vigan07g127700 [Vigna angularis]